MLWNFRENCNEKMEQFLKRCFYHSGQYDSQENFAALDKKLKEHEVIGQKNILNDLIYNNSMWFQCHWNFNLEFNENPFEFKTYFCRVGELLIACFIFQFLLIYS